jgi:hypothetical protein
VLRSACCATILPVILGLAPVSIGVAAEPAALACATSCCWPGAGVAPSLLALGEASP